MKVKPFISLVISLIIFNSCSQYPSDNKTFFLKGIIDGANTEYLILHYNDSSNIRKSDTIKINNNTFFKEGNLNNTQKAAITSNLSGNYIDANGLLFFLEANEINLVIKEGEFAKAKIDGSNTEIEKEDLNKVTKPLHEKIEFIINKRKKLITQTKQAENKDLKTEIKKLSKEGKRISEEIKNIQLQYALDNPQSYLSADLIDIYKKSISNDSLKMLYNNLSPTIKESSYGQKIQEQIDLQIVNSGDLAPRFSGEDIDGEKLSLHEFLGKFILLDFGADWCIPCKKEIPEVKRIYDKFHSKGLEIIGISFDKDIAIWKDNIENEKLNWYNIYEGLSNVGKNGSISKSYQVQPIPAYILIDDKGIIVDRYRNADKDDKSLKDLEEKLSELIVYE